ncbi:hypothetical protein D3C85_669500 [compost metagenome]
MSTVTLDTQHNFGIRTYTNLVHHLLPVVQRLAIQRQQAVTGLQAGGLRRPFGVELSQHRRQGRTPRTNTERTNRIWLIGTLEPLIKHQLTRRVGTGALLTHQQMNGPAFTQAPDQLQIDFRPPCRRLAVDSRDFLPRTQARLRGNTTGLDTTNDRTHLLAAQHRQAPEEHEGQQEVSDRARRNDCNALTDGFAIEGLIKLIGRYFAFTLIEHFHVATQGDGGDHELGATPIMPAQQRHAEAHGETQHLDATATRDPEMAKFVKGDQHAQGHQGADNHIERAHLLSPQSCSLLHGPTYCSTYRP